MTDYRAVFDAHVTFVNGGGLTAEGFRLDVPSKDMAEDEVARLLVQHLGSRSSGRCAWTACGSSRSSTREAAASRRPPGPSLPGGRSST